MGSGGVVRQLLIIRVIPECPIGQSVGRKTSPQSLELFCDLGGGFERLLTSIRRRQLGRWRLKLGRVVVSGDSLVLRGVPEIRIAGAAQDVNPCRPSDVDQR